MKKVPVEPSRESNPSSVRRALLEAAHSRMRSRAWMQKQKNKATGVGALARGTKSSFASLEVNQQYVVIKEANPLSKMRRIVLPSEKCNTLINPYYA